MYKITPAMGWNSWNTYGLDISEKIILETTDFLISSGLKDVGYEYIVIDDGWSLKERDVNGRLVPDPIKFPHGIKYVSDYVHSKGLKFGMYSCAGAVTCGGYPGSFDHEFIDAKTFAEWGVDYLKYDYCFTSLSQKGSYLYKRMGVALANCGRDILFSACTGGMDDTRYWIKETGAHSWRSTCDILDNWKSIKDLIFSQMKTMELNGQGCFNDMDMLVVGMEGVGFVGKGGCTYDEYFTHFAFWCMFGSTLMIGSDIRKLSDEARAILFNKDLIRINQDKKYNQPFIINYRLTKNAEITVDNPYYLKNYSDETTVFAKFLDDGKIAIGFFNLSDRVATSYEARFVLDDIGIPESTGKTLKMRNVVNGEIKVVNNGFCFEDEIKPHCSKVYICEIIDK